MIAVDLEMAGLLERLRRCNPTTFEKLKSRVRVLVEKEEIAAHDFARAVLLSDHAELPANPSAT